MADHLHIFETLERVGGRLQAAYGDELIPRAELVKQVAAECGCSPDSVIPSDHCYNRTNDGMPEDNTPIFILEERGLYRFVGRAYSYTGALWHHPTGGEPYQIGQWVAGKLARF
jgi:hypothetical protein